MMQVKLAVSLLEKVSMN